MEKTDWQELLGTLGFDNTKDFREEQFKGSKAVADVYIKSTISNKHSILLEAPTGIGKTLMYLGPLSIYNTWPIIVSTSGKLLQKQIANTAEKLDLEHVVLMGRSNYLCKNACSHYLKDMPKNHEFFEELTWLCDILKDSNNHELQAVLTLGWSEKFITFMKQHLTAASCFCRNDEHNCYYKGLEKKAFESSLVILNHHALFSLRESPLFENKILVADEAHALPEAASSVLSKSVSTGYLRALQQRADLCFEVCSDKVAEFHSMLERLIGLIQSNVQGGVYVPDNNFWGTFYKDTEFLEETPFPLWVQNRCSPFYRNILVELNSEWHTVYEFIRGILSDTAFDDDKGIFYFEPVGKDQAALKYSPIETKELLEEFWQKWVGTIGLSATLALPGKEPEHEFDYFINLCGFPKPDQTYKLKSPFDYQKQCRVFIPATGSVYDCTSVVNPELFLKERICLTGSLIKAFDGRTLALYTAAMRLEGHAAVLKKIFPDQILAQGGESVGNDELAELFIKEPQKVLLGTRAFFQGFDAPGDTLSCEILEKLPFPRRDDPILKAKMELAGDQWFDELILPAMLMDLRQAFGRLIRKESDRGIFVLTDNRFLTKDYRSAVETVFCGIEIETFKTPAELLQKISSTIDFSEFNDRFSEEWNAFSQTALFRRITGMRSLDDLLKKMNIPHLYGWQKKIIDNVLSGVPAQFVIHPAGSGKSLTYQLPALMRPGLTLVISPLKALMYDQVESLKNKTGFKDEIAYLNSDISDENEIKKIYSQVAQGKIRLLYVAPERLHKNFINLLLKNGISMLVIDEAHMISEAGTQWRPSYGELKRAWEIFGKPQTLALTATAEESVKQEIKEAFGITDEYISEDSVVRPRVKFSVKVIKNSSGYYTQIDNFIRRSHGKPVLIYCSTAENVVRVATYLSKKNYSVGMYHRNKTAKYAISPEKLNETHQKFLKNEIDILVATKAYGMGIDKPDIWGILYNNAPISLGELVQGAGRVCRDKTILDEYIKQGCPPEISVTFFEENDFTGKNGQSEWAVDRPFEELLNIGSNILGQLPERGDKAISCTNYDTVLNEDLMKACILLARFMHSEKMLKDYYFDWKTSEFHFIGITEKVKADKDYQFYIYTKMCDRSMQMYSVIDFCKKYTCRNNALHTYFSGQKIQMKCYACDVCGFDLEKHNQYLNYVKSVSDDYVRKFNCGVFQSDDKAFLQYLRDSGDQITEQLAYLRKEHLQSGQVYSDALLAATLLELQQKKENPIDTVSSFASLSRHLTNVKDSVVTKELVLEFFKQNKIPLGKKYLTLFSNLQSFVDETRVLSPLQATKNILEKCFLLNQEIISIESKPMQKAMKEWIEKETGPWADFIFSANFTCCVHYMKLGKISSVLSYDISDENAWDEWDNLKKYLVYLKKLNKSDEKKIIFLLDFIKTLPEEHRKEWELILQAPEEFLALQNDETEHHEWNCDSLVFQSKMLPCRMKQESLVIAELDSDAVLEKIPVNQWNDLINILPVTGKFYPETKTFWQRMTELALPQDFMKKMPESLNNTYQKLPYFLRAFMEHKVFFFRSEANNISQDTKDQKKLNSLSDLSMNIIYGKK